MKLLQASTRFVKNNASTILTCLGGAGVVGTTVLAVKATPKAMVLIERAKEEKGENLTITEKVITAGPVYIPTVLAGVSTIACIFGANILNKRHQAALMSAYALLDNSYKEYREKVKELYGEDVDVQVRDEMVKDKHDGQRPDDGKRLFYDEFSERYFEATTEQVLTAEYQVNNWLAQGGGVFLNEFYEELGIDTVDYGDYLGWSAVELSELQCYSWIEFSHRKTFIDDDLECTIISMHFDPTFDFENY